MCICVFNDGNALEHRETTRTYKAVCVTSVVCVTWCKSHGRDNPVSKMMTTHIPNNEKITSDIGKATLRGRRRNEDIE